jgi:Arf-GAP/coiled-coil/ANK repeat/PH domain-containing protein
LVDELLQMTALSNIEAKKKFEFLEAVSGSMDAHLRYFKQASFPEDIWFF